MQRRINIVLIVILLIIIVLSLIFLPSLLKIKEAVTDIKNSKEFVIDRERDSNVSKDGLRLNFDSIAFAIIDSVVERGENLAKEFKGINVTILITGLDSRIGVRSGHADANQLLIIWLDSAKVEVISIPRGTYADAGLAENDTNNQNYLSNVRAVKGRERYFKEVCRIVGIPKIDYYVEFGFSQAIGLLELIGFKDNATGMLRLLRARKSFSTGDNQRAFNQGQFIRQMILKLFKEFNSPTGDIIIRTGLALVETNLDYNIIRNILKILGEKGFPKSNNDIVIRIKPKLSSRYSEFDFTNKNTIDSLTKRLNQISDNLGIDAKTSNISQKVFSKLNTLIQSSFQDTAKNPKRIISKLETIFLQKSWYQINNPEQRKTIAHLICSILYNAYIKMNEIEKSTKVRDYIENQK